MFAGKFLLLVSINISSLNPILNSFGGPPHVRFRLGVKLLLTLRKLL